MPESFIHLQGGSQRYVSNKTLFQKQVNFANQFCTNSTKGFVMPSRFMWELFISQIRRWVFLTPANPELLLRYSCIIQNLHHGSFHRLRPFSVPLVSSHRCKCGLGLAPQTRTYLIVLVRWESQKKIHFSPFQVHLQGQEQKENKQKKFKKFICNEQRIIQICTHTGNEIVPWEHFYILALQR